MGRVYEVDLCVGRTAQPDVFTIGCAGNGEGGGVDFRLGPRKADVVLENIITLARFTVLRLTVTYIPWGMAWGRGAKGRRYTAALGKLVYGQTDTSCLL